MSCLSWKYIFMTSCRCLFADWEGLDVHFLKKFVARGERRLYGLKSNNGSRKSLMVKSFLKLNRWEVFFLIPNHVDVAFQVYLYLLASHVYFWLSVSFCVNNFWGARMCVKKVKPSNNIADRDNLLQYKFLHPVNNFSNVSHENKNYLLDIR